MGIKTSNITQGSNLPIYIHTRFDATGLRALSVILTKGSSVVKQWEKDDCTLTEDGIICPITRTESLALPKGTAQIEVAFTTSEGVVFPPIRQSVYIEKRDDQTELDGELIPQTIVYDNIELQIDEISLSAIIGASAYEVAVKNGFVGTESEWLASLKGDRGERGERGLDGVAGKDGYTPRKNIDYFDGKDGLNGRDGRDGKDYILTESDKQEIAEKVPSQPYDDSEIRGEINHLKEDYDEQATTISNHENRIQTLERGGGSGYDDTEIQNRITEVDSRLSESIAEISEELGSLIVNSNLVNFASTKYDDALTKNGLSVSNRTKNTISLSSTNEYSLFFNVDVKPSTRYEFNAITSVSGSANLRLYVDNDFWNFKETKSYYTTKTNETSIAIRVYVDANASISITSIRVAEYGKEDGFNSEYLKPFLDPLNDELLGKQDKIIAGSNIRIEEDGKTISAELPETEKVDIVEDLMHWANVLNFADEKYDALLSTVSVEERKRSSVKLSTITEKALFFDVDTLENTKYTISCQYMQTGTANVRLCDANNNIIKSITSRDSSYTTETGETTLKVRIYLDVNSSINISDFKFVADGDGDAINEKYLKVYQYAKSSNNAVSNEWNVGSLNGDGTVNSSATSLRYSNPIRVLKGLTYFTSGYNNSLASIKFYSEKPDLSSQNPTTPSRSYDSSAYFTADENGYIVIISSELYATTIYEKYIDDDNSIKPLIDIIKASVLKAGNNITIDEDGKISASGGTTESVKVVEQREIVNKVERQVVNTTIETVQGSRYASLYGVLPSNDASTNTSNLQSLLNDGGTIIVDIAGVYEFNQCLIVGSNTTLICYDGVYFKQNNEYGGGIILNKGALNKEYDTNITIDGLKFMYDGHDGSPTRTIHGLRGKISFYYAKNVTIKNVICTDITPYTFFIHLACFDNVLIEGCEIRGQKDGIHVSRGNGLTIRRCVIGTHDDPIALNAHDYIESCPELGWIRNVLVEDCVNEQSEGVVPGSRGVLILGGAWSDWTSGNSYRRGDSVVGSNGYVYRLSAEVKTNPDGSTVEYVSTSEPTHSEGSQTYPDGITWMCVQHDTVYNAGVENVTFRNYNLNVRHDSVFLIDADDTPHSRGVYPNVCAMPHKNITFDNVTVNPEVQSGIPMFVNISYPCDLVRLLNCNFSGYTVIRNQFKAWDTVNGNNKSNVYINGCKFIKGKDCASMMLSVLSHDINIKCDAYGNHVDEALRINAQNGSFVMKNDDLTKNIW